MIFIAKDFSDKPLTIDLPPGMLTKMVLRPRNLVLDQITLLAYYRPHYLYRKKLYQLLTVHAELSSSILAGDFNDGMESSYKISSPAWTHNVKPQVLPEVINTLKYSYSLQNPSKYSLMKKRYNSTPDWIFISDDLATHTHRGGKQALQKRL